MEIPHASLTPSLPDSLKASFRMQSFEGGLDTAHWNNMQAIHKVVSASPVIRDNLPVYYPGAGSDITLPLAMTNGRRFVFVDYLYKTNDGSPTVDTGLVEEIESIGGKVTTEKTEGTLGEGGRRILTFDWEGQAREITLYAEDATRFTPPELKEKGAAMVVVQAPTPAPRGQDEEFPGYLYSIPAKSALTHAVARGGFVHRKPVDKLPLEVVGFTMVIPEEDKVKGLYQKTDDVLDLENLLVIDEALRGFEETKYGGFLKKIDESTLGTLEEQMKALKATLSHLPLAKQQELTPILQQIFMAEHISPEGMTQLVRLLSDEETVVQYVQHIADLAKKQFPEITKTE